MGGRAEEGRVRSGWGGGGGESRGLIPHPTVQDQINSTGSWPEIRKLSKKELYIFMTNRGLTNKLTTG